MPLPVDPERDTATVDTVISMLQRGKQPAEGRFFTNALKWIENFPGHIDVGRKKTLLEAVQWCFDITEQELYAHIAGTALPRGKAASSRNGHGGAGGNPEAELDARIPPSGWLRSYVEFTRFCEAPMPYHIFCSLVVLGAALGRRVKLESGHYNTYPNLCVMLIGPPGRLKKSTAVGIARKLVLKANLCPIFPDKCTPEYFATVLKDHPHQFIGAPELSMFLGRQKYNEGLVTLLLRLLDTEDIPIDVGTVGRGEEYVENHVLSMIGGSTMSLLTQATADQVASSGFLSRFVSVVETDTPRCFPEPIKGDFRHENELLLRLDWMKNQRGIMEMSSEATATYDEWYRRRWTVQRSIQDDTLAQVQERGAEHMKRISMLLHLADHRTHLVCSECVKMAAWLLAYTERNIPVMVNAINHTAKAGEAETILDHIRRAGGAIDHSKLLRGLSSKGVDAAALRGHILTLRERGQVREEKRGSLRFYLLEGEE